MNKLSDTIWINYLRSFITILVIAHHAALAYTTFAHFDSEAYIRSTHPIVDFNRWSALDIMVNFNDIFFMSLMFLIGGLFLSNSINKKGLKTFLKDRFFRLFVPFIVGGTSLMLIAYFPAYRVAKGNVFLIDYLLDFFTVQAWPVGPPWFIWMLFLFNGLFTLLFLLSKKIISKTGLYISELGEKPVLLVVFMVLFGWIIYVPLTVILGPGYWTGIGPFDFQVNRVLLYFGYFLIGVFIGSSDFTNKIFSKKSSLIRNWKLWIILAILSFVLLTIIPYRIEKHIQLNMIAELHGWILYHTIFVLSCTFTSLSFISIFRKLFHSSFKWWDSLSENAYMIYLCHFVFITWYQYILLKMSWHASIKFLLVFLLSLISSWLFSIAIRKIAFIKRYI